MSSTDVADRSLAAPRGKDQRLTAAFWPTLAATLLGILVISLPNLADPVIRFDDYPAYFADPTGFWLKTLHEGRWVNYLWHLREVVTPAWLNFAVYQALWAACAAAIAAKTIETREGQFFAVTLALMILVSPSAMLISLWFNTLIPGLALVALYASLALVLSPRAVRVLLPVFVILTFMAYTTYPLLVLAVAIVSTRRRSFLDLIGLLALFAASFLAAVLAVYALNWQVHGIFGVPLAEWRDAAPASDLSGVVANFPKVMSSLSALLDKVSFGFYPAALFHLFLIGGGLVVLARRAPLEALYLAAGLVTGLALVAVQVLKMGAIVPPRAFIFAWVFYAIIAVRAAQELSVGSPLGGRLGRNAVLLVVMSYLLQTFQQYTVYRGWQAETRYLAQVTLPLGDTLYVTGSATALPSAREAGLQDNRGFAFRMQQIAGQTVIFCERTPQLCTEDGSPQSVETPISGLRFEIHGDQVWIRFPEET